MCIWEELRYAAGALSNFPEMCDNDACYTRLHRFNRGSRMNDLAQAAEHCRRSAGAGEETSGMAGAVLQGSRHAGVWEKRKISVMAVEKVKEYFKGTGIEVIELPESSATVELAAEALHTEPDQIAKTLSFLVDGKPVLIVMAGMARVDNHKYKEYFHKKAMMTPHDQVETYIGHAPGGVCPFAVKEGATVYLDASLRRHEVVYPAAGSGNSAVRVTLSQLEQYSGYRAWIDVAK